MFVSSHNKWKSGLRNCKIVATFINLFCLLFVIFNCFCIFYYLIVCICLYFTVFSFSQLLFVIEIIFNLFFCVWKVCDSKCFYLSSQGLQMKTSQLAKSGTFTAMLIDVHCPSPQKKTSNIYHSRLLHQQWLQTIVTPSLFVYWCEKTLL